MSSSEGDLVIGYGVGLSGCGCLGGLKAPQAVPSDGALCVLALHAGRVRDLPLLARTLVCERLHVRVGERRERVAVGGAEAIQGPRPVLSLSRLEFSCFTEF